MGCIYFETHYTWHHLTDYPMYIGKKFSEYGSENMRKMFKLFSKPWIRTTPGSHCLSLTPSVIQQYLSAHLKDLFKLPSLHVINKPPPINYVIQTPTNRDGVI